jgi:hypothetical protein
MFPPDRLKAMDAKHILVLVLMLMTLLSLVAGVGMMMIGGKLNAKYGNKMMVARVSLQGLTVLLIGLLFLVGKPG